MTWPAERLRAARTARLRDLFRIASGGSSGRPQTFSDAKTTRIRLPVALPLPAMVAGLNEANPDVVVAYASILPELAHQARAGRLRIAPRSICSVSEPLLPEIRAVAEQTWSVPVMNWWASSEGGGMGIACGLGAVHPHLFRSRLGRDRNIVEYQVRQTARGAAIAIRTRGEVDTARLHEEIAADLARLGVQAPGVAVLQVDQLQRQATGKLKRFVPIPATSHEDATNMASARFMEGRVTDSPRLAHMAVRDHELCNWQEGELDAPPFVRRRLDRGRPHDRSRRVLRLP